MSLLTRRSFLIATAGGVVFLALTGAARAAPASVDGGAHKNGAQGAEDCLPVSAIDDWRAYDNDTLSVFGDGRELARIDIAMSGPSDTWIMHLIHKVRYEGGGDGLLCPRGSDTLVLDGRRHLIDGIILIAPKAEAEPARLGE